MLPVDVVRAEGLGFSRRATASAGRAPGPSVAATRSEPSLRRAQSQAGDCFQATGAMSEDKVNSFREHSCFDGQLVNPRQPLPLVIPQSLIQISAHVLNGSLLPGPAIARLARAFLAVFSSPRCAGPLRALSIRSQRVPGGVPTWRTRRDTRSVGPYLLPRSQSVATTVGRRVDRPISIRSHARHGPRGRLIERQLFPALEKCHNARRA